MLSYCSSTRLKRYRESGQPCLVPDFNGMALGFSPFNLMLAVDCVCLWVSMGTFSNCVQVPVEAKRKY